MPSKDQEIYQPKKDSYILAQEIIKFLKTKSKKQIQEMQVLDMGSGSGVQAQTCIEMQILKQNILCIDINPIAIKHLKTKNFRTKKSDLFENIIPNNTKNKFNLILFNPPYLPTSKYDDNYDTIAGKKGNETIIRFLKQAKNYLNKNATILLLFSSLSKPNTILKNAKQLNYKSKLLIKKPVGFFEQLYVYEFKL